jgi:hypothetical protein
MESNDLNPSLPDDAHLESWLRANATLPPLPDDGMSRRVLAALPPRTRTLSSRLAATLAGTAMGLVVVGLQVFAGGNPLDRLPAFDAALAESLSQLGSPAAGLAVVATVGSLVFAFWSDLQRFVRR